MADMTATSAPAASPAPTEAPAVAGFVICIACKPDGTFNVSSEPMEAEEKGEGVGKPVSSIGEALKEAINIYQNQGTTGEGEFQAGFGAGESAGPEETATMGAM